MAPHTLDPRLCGPAGSLTAGAVPRPPLKRIAASLLRLLPSATQRELRRWRFRHSCPTPVTFREKLVWRALHCDNPLLSLTADKAEVRPYVAQRIGEKYLPRHFGVYTATDEIPFEDITVGYVVKATHGSGWNYFVRDPRTVDLKELRRETNRWLKSSYGTGSEWWYAQIQPRLIVEELMVTKNGECPEDYKFFVFNGKVALLQVDTGRFSDHRRTIYTPEWSRLDCELKYPGGPTTRPPDNLKEMVRLASLLGSDFDFVRVDLYSYQGRIVFGELTHCPDGGSAPFSDPKIEEWLGNMFQISTPCR